MPERTLFARVPERFVLLAKRAALTCLAASALITLNSVASHGARGLFGGGDEEVRTISFYQVHTKETVTVTYKRNGRYIPQAMSKINHVLRDWRRNEPIRMDPEVIDLVWELHADLGSKKPIHIISGYRSPKTNAMLKRIGRSVARRSMHIQGKAIDLYFPDVSSARIRNSALVREVGGVGYYPRSGKHGFIHVDTGQVRHWPRISKTRLAKIKRQYRSTVGARNGRAPVQLAVAEPAAPEQIKAPVPISRPVVLDTIAAAVPAPVPRPRPLEVLVAAAADFKVSPASAPAPTRNFASRPSMLLGHSTRDNFEAVMRSAALAIPDSPLVITPQIGLNQRSNASAKAGSAPEESRIVTKTSLEQPAAREHSQPGEQRSSGGVLAWLGNIADSLFGGDSETDTVEQKTAAPVQKVLKTLSQQQADELDDSITGLNSDAQGRAAPLPAGDDALNVNRGGKGDMMMGKHRTSSLARESGPAHSEIDILLDGGAQPISFK